MGLSLSTASVISDFRPTDGDEKVPLTRKPEDNEVPRSNRGSLFMIIRHRRQAMFAIHTRRCADTGLILTP